ncbi:MAG: group II intron maturase-specific domain-containing protein [Bacteroides thetaiotaomicron]
MKEKIRAITKRNRGVSIQQVLEELNMVTRGWINYFRIAGCKTFLAKAGRMDTDSVANLYLETMAVYPHTYQETEAV